MEKLYTDQQAPLDFKGQTKEEYLADIEGCEVAYSDEDFPEFLGMTAEQIFDHYVATGFIVAVEDTLIIDVTLGVSHLDHTPQENERFAREVYKAISDKYPQRQIYVDYQDRSTASDLIECDEDILEDIEYIIERTLERF